MIVEERLYELTGMRVKFNAIDNVGISVDIEDLKVAGEEIKVRYRFVATYETGVGKIRVRGMLVMKEDAKLAKAVADSWKKSKKLPNDYVPVLMGAVNYVAGANGTVLAKTLGLPVPLVPPRFELRQR